MSVPIVHLQPASAYRRRAQAPRHVAFIAGEIVLLALLAALSLLVHGHPGPLPADVGIERDVQSALLGSRVATPVEAVSTLNWPVPVAATLTVVFLVFLALRRWLDAVIVPLAALAESLSTLLLSRWVHRPRPAGHGIHRLQVITGTYSFPSGHVAYAFAVFALFIFLTTQIRRPIHPALLWIVRIVLLLLIVLMPVSRILEGEHWPSDTLAGAFDGLFWLVLFAHVYLWARARWPVLLARDER